MNLNFEYNQDLVIDGKKFVLNHVENDDLGDRFRIRRQYLRWDGKERKYFEQIVLKPKPLPIAVTEPKAPSASEGPKAPIQDERPKAPSPAEGAPEAAPTAAPDSQPGFFSRTFGGKRVKKGKK